MKCGGTEASKMMLKASQLEIVGKCNIDKAHGLMSNEAT